jgi:hypothetical protein
VERSIGLVGNSLRGTFRFSRPLSRTVRVSVYAFGYRKDVPFERMPKVNIQFRTLGYEVVDQGRRLAKDSIHAVQDAQHLVVDVPLALLGNPDRVLTSARTYVGELPLDALSWRCVEIDPALTKSNAPLHGKTEPVP